MLYCEIEKLYVIAFFIGVTKSWMAWWLHFLLQIGNFHVALHDKASLGKTEQIHVMWVINNMIAYQEINRKNCMRSTFPLVKIDSLK